MSLEDRLEQMMLKVGRAADALERIAAVLEANSNVGGPSLTGSSNTGGIPEEAPKPRAKREKSVPAPAPAAEPEPAIDDLGAGVNPTPVYTMEDVAMSLRNVIAKEGNKQAKAIELMVKYGANKAKPMVKDIKSEFYAALIKDATEFVGK